MDFTLTEQRRVVQVGIFTTGIPLVFADIDKCLTKSEEAVGIIESPQRTVLMELGCSYFYVLMDFPFPLWYGGITISLCQDYKYGDPLGLNRGAKYLETDELLICVDSIGNLYRKEKVLWSPTTNLSSYLQKQKVQNTLKQKAWTEQMLVDYLLSLICAIYKRSKVYGITLPPFSISNEDETIISPDRKTARMERKVVSRMARIATRIENKLRIQGDFKGRLAHEFYEKTQNSTRH